MRRLFPVLLLLSFSPFGTSLAGDEGRATKQSVSNLLKQLEDKNPDKVRAAVRALGKHASAKEVVPALKELLKNPNGRVKWAAAEALWRLEHKAADLVPVYTELLTATDADIRAASAWRLGRLGSEACPAVVVLAAALRDESLEVRAQVAQALANLGAWAEPALPALVRALGDERLDEPSPGHKGWESVRRSPALPALVELADRAIPLLIETFRERAVKREPKDLSGMLGWEVASRVAHAFPAFGRKAVAPLVRTLEAKEASMRLYAAIALREIAQFHGLPDNAVEKLEKCLDDSGEGIPRVAASAMSWVRPANRKAGTILAKSYAGGLSDSRAMLADLKRMSPHNEAARKLLFRMLGDEHAETSQEAHRILADLELPAEQVIGAWTKALSHADSNVRCQATSALTKLGPGAKPAKPRLLERFPKETDYHCSGGILDALTAIDPDDPALVPLLVKSMDDSESWMRYRALQCLGGLGPRAKDSLPWLKARLLKPKAKGKEAALDDIKMERLVGAIVHIAPGSATTAATLLEALRHRDIRAVHCPKNTWYMRDRLEDELHTTLPAALPLLREALKDKDADVRRSAALVLLRAGLETKTALPVLMANLWSETDKFDDQWRFQRRVVELLSRRHSPVTPAVAAAWCGAWQTATPEVREVLEPGLLVLQPEALPHLLDQLRKAKTAQVRRDLAHLLANFAGQSERILPILREELRDPKIASQYAAAQALIRIGPDAAEAVPELIPLLSSSHLGMRAVAAQALASMGRAAKPAVRALKSMLKDARPEMRLVAASALSQIDPDVSESLALLLDALTNQRKHGFWDNARIELPDGFTFRALFDDSIEEGIARFGERAVLALSDLLDNVELDEWSADNVSSQCGARVRIQAALLLAEIGPGAHKAVPALMLALEDRDPFLRDAAASALGRIGPAAKEAVSACINLLDQQNRVASAGGTWNSSSPGGGHSSAANRVEYGGPFDFRSLGRRNSVSNGSFGYGFVSNRDSYAGIRPSFPFDAAYVLGRIDTEKRAAYPILREMARDPNHPGRLSAALAMWRSGSEASDLVPAFTAALEAHAGRAKNETVPLSREIRECLAELGIQLKPTVCVMAKWLKQRQSSAEVDDQVAVLEALGQLGADAKSEAALLRPMLQGDRWNARRRVAAALALYRIGGDKDLVFPVLREVLLGLEDHASVYYSPDRTDTARVHAARALGVLAEKGDARAKSLIIETAKGDENPYVQVAALEAMARLKLTNTPAVRGLCVALRHPVARVRIAAASACGRLGPLAKSSAKALGVATEDSQMAVRQAARQALKGLD